jgi:uncharacterized protein
MSRDAQSWLDAAMRAKQAATAAADATDAAELANAADASGVNGSVLSPCIGVCLMDSESGFCRGCLRTLGEIAAWAGATNADRRAIRASLPGRQGLVKPPL